jgi:protein-S-isoprenylcysteine O-methyltransferase Ste14
MNKAISQYGLFLVIAVLFFFAATGNLFSSSPVVIAVQILAVGLLVWARRSFPAGAFRVDATPSAETVIRQGPYRLIRHPMYTGALMFTWASVLSHFSVLTGTLGAVVTIVIALRVVFEERFLRERYPDYAAYMQTTKAVVPYLI